MREHNLLIDCEELEARLDEKTVCVVDCRFELLAPDAGQRLYRESHIPGAVYADLDRDLAAPVGPGTGRHPLPEPDVLATRLGRLGIDRSTDVVVYDQGSGAVAARLWWLLRWLGNDRGRLLDGGFARWQQLRLPLEGGPVSREPRTFAAAPRDDLVITADDLLAAGMPCEALQLVDARSAERFSGSEEPIDAVAGHIPGAINLPFGANLGPDGRWKSPDELRQMWENLLGNGAGEAWSTMCGSGVTACHHVVSGLLAGLPEPRVYVGSWSEWITDRTRPIANGDD